MSVQTKADQAYVKHIFVQIIFILAIATTDRLWAQDPKPDEPGWIEPSAIATNTPRIGRSPFTPPEANDTTFVVDSDSGLDTGCVFKNSGTLIFRIPIVRVISDKSILVENGLLGETAILRMPVWDVDYDVPNLDPELEPQRDIVRFNGKVVSESYLTGSNNTWVQNTFEIPIDQVVFPTEPHGPGLTPGETVQTPAYNYISIEIDTANSQPVWCVEVDWASLEIETARPVVMAHGILSRGSAWNFWAEHLESLGLPNDNSLDLGNLGSIASNAEKIGAKVAEASERWGVDKVNLVTHSKGGIDGRHYVENAENIEQLIQIGTPNAGSPLADYIQAGMIFIGAQTKEVNRWVNRLAGPAGVQLTTPYMKFYNWRHGFNPEVRYTALAGGYRTGCPLISWSCYPARKLLGNILPGSDDLIVPISSVYSLNYTDDRFFTSLGDNTEAAHSCIPGFNGCLTQSLAVYNRLDDRVELFGTNAASIASEPNFAHSATVGGMIANGESHQVEFPIDQAGNVFFSIMYPVSDLDLEFTLTSPSGQTISAQDAIADPDIGHEEAEFIGGMMQVYNLGDAEAGTWVAEISAHSASGSAADIAFAVSGWMSNSPITLNAQFKPPAIASGEDLVFEAVVAQAGVPITDAVVTATVAFPDDATTEVDLFDNGQEVDEVAGDGIYTGVLSDTAQSGMYRVVFRASRQGSAMGPDFSRELFDIATVSASATRFTGDFTDVGVDTNGNGLYDELNIEVGLDVSDTALYRVFGVLTDENNNVHHAHVLTELDPGTQTITLSFDGEAIFRTGVDGPYVLSRISMSEEDEEGLDILPVDEVLEAHVTGPHLYTDFEHAPLLLMGTGTSKGVDTNGNGLFEYLEASVDALVEKPGTYRWSATLRDTDGGQIDIANGNGYLTQGENAMVFTFDGEAIGENGVDGPYDVTGLLLYGAGESLVAGKVYSTLAFTADQFEGFIVDSDDDGIPNDYDACPASDLGESIDIQGCDNGVSNKLFADGCTSIDLIMQCANNAKNHGQFASCVTQQTNQWKSDGVITGSDSGMIQHCAAQASLP